MSSAEESVVTWRKTVEKALGDRPFASLVRKDGALTIQPLYTAADVAALGERGAVGVAPFVRGSLGRPELGVVSGARGDAAAGEVREAAANGASAVYLATPAALGAQDIEAIAGRGGSAGGAQPREGLPALFLRGAPDSKHDALIDAAARHGLRLSLGEDPLDHPEGALDRAALARAHATCGGLPQILVDTLAQHDAGASPQVEVGVALAAFAGCLREGADALGIAVAVASSDDVFETIAKIRALRLGLAKVRAALGHAPAAHVVLGVVSRRRFVRYDVATNILRGTTGAFGLAVGGADAVFARPFDEALGASVPASRRLAMSTLLVLGEEAGALDVRDAAGGAYYVEALAEQIGANAWEELRAIERAGGIRAARSFGVIAERVTRDREARRAEVRKRKRMIVGLSDFALADETLPGGEARAEAERARRATAAAEDPTLARDGADFEALRDGAARIEATRGTPPRLLCVTIGPPRDHGPREAFTRRLFEAGGFTVTTVSAGAATPDAIAAADVVVVAGSDRGYAEKALETVTTLRSLTERPLWLAGNPFTTEQAAERAALLAAGLDDLFVAGADAVALLERAQRAAAGGAA